ncbi:hypothetical protein V8B55DRAFT_1515603 [Mucor lusitanicus]|uniref:Uncharacterized protein n=2 Tax=Mucor circinelloides f. lusitanicus TaxID=29924 RepID=A0A168KY46_MUCCL|nr:hypothetical protein FB192DRAFT_1451648 [Mucor lusitanicus]OAD02906.1 hypothetical protein MUCCIDRAFT_109754 [Mucor lusitanicus CBS 277.49]
MTDTAADKSRIPENCRLFEMVQYQCEATRYNIECSPFVRLFLRCAGLPTVEVTPEYDQYGDPKSRSSPSINASPIKGDQDQQPIN